MHIDDVDIDIDELKRQVDEIRTLMDELKNKFYNKPSDEMKRKNAGYIA